MERDGNSVNGADLNDLLKDPILNDLPPNVSLERIQEHLDILYGRAFSLQIETVIGDSMEIFVPINGTIKDLKKKIQAKFNQELKDKCKSISWRYIWKRYWLFANNTKLTEDNKLIKE